MKSDSPKSCHYSFFVLSNVDWFVEEMIKLGKINFYVKKTYKTFEAITEGKNNYKK